MKKILILGLLLSSLTQCKAQTNDKVYNCEQSLTHWRNYEDTICVEFIFIDSSIFKGKNYRDVADSLFWSDNVRYHKRDIRNIKTGEIHRVIWDNRFAENFDLIPYDRTIYELK